MIFPAAGAAAEPDWKNLFEPSGSTGLPAIFQRSTPFERLISEADALGHLHSADLDRLTT
jgi:hypothetical protein